MFRAMIVAVAALAFSATSVYACPTCHVGAVGVAVDYAVPAAAVVPLGVPTVSYAAVDACGNPALAAAAPVPLVYGSVYALPAVSLQSFHVANVRVKSFHASKSFGVRNFHAADIRVRNQPVRVRSVQKFRVR